jgi:DHA2 family multidrug resistance protein-like MFS transporter
MVHGRTDRPPAKEDTMAPDTGTSTGPVTNLPRTNWGAILAVSLAIMLAALDLTIVAVALPLIGADLAAPPAVTQWVLLAYFLPMTALGIPSGRWMDRAGLRPAFTLAVGGFGIASALVALAPTLGLLLTGRVLQGAFGSLISILGFPIVAAAARPEHRGRAMALITTLIPLSGLAGPGLGGLLAQAYGWRSVFAVNIPIVLVTLWLGLRAVPAGQPGRRGLPWPGLGSLREAVLLGGSVTAVFLGLGALSATPAGSGYMVAAGLAVVAATAAVVWARLPASRSVSALIRRPVFGFSVAALLLVMTGTGATFFLVPYFFSAVLHRSPAVAGAALLASAAAMAVVSPLAGLLADRVGAPLVAVAGGTVILAGTLAMLQLDGGARPADAAWRLAVLGVGNGLFSGPVHTLVLGATPPGMSATAGGVAALFRTLGLSLGPATAALSWSVTGGGVAGYRTGLAVITVMTLAGTVAVAMPRFRSRHRSGHLEQATTSAMEPAA